MSREFLIWVFLETTYKVFREQFMKAGQLLPREDFILLPVVPIWMPSSVAQLYASGAAIAAMNLAGPIMVKGLPQTPNGRK